jgi:SAM-dependent methyltransferase
MPDSDGSYTFDRFTVTSQEREMARLQHQATLLLPIESRIWTLAGLHSGMQVVDIGCGAGIISGAIARKISHGKVWGIDRSTALLDAAAKFSASQQILNLSFIPGDVYDLPLLDGTIDFVYGRLLFQHLTEPLRALKELDRVLKPGGTICLVDIVDSWFTLDPEPPAFTALRQRLLPIQRAQGGDPQVGSKLGNYLAAAGFGEIETRVEVVTSDKLGGIGRFLELLSFGNPYHSIDPDLELLVASARQATAKLATLPHAWAAFGLFVTTGRKC